MIRVSRLRRVAIIAIVTVLFIFIHSAYTVHDHSGKSLDKGIILPFEVIVTGQDADREVGKSGGKSRAAASSLEGQTCRIPKLDINGSEVKDFFFKPMPLECSKNPQNWLFIDSGNNVQYIESRKNAKCQGSYVTRKNDTMNIQTAFDSLPAGKPMKSDFAVVSCRDGEQTCCQDNYKAAAVITTDPMNLLPHSIQPKSGKPRWMRVQRNLRYIMWSFTEDKSGLISITIIPFHMVAGVSTSNSALYLRNYNSMCCCLSFSMN